MGASWTTEAAGAIISEGASTSLASSDKERSGPKKRDLDGAMSIEWNQPEIFPPEPDAVDSSAGDLEPDVGLSTTSWEPIL